MKPISGDRARLVNISKSGVLLETTARLQPGRRSTVVIVDGTDRKKRTEGKVIRTELVSISPTGELIYLTAMAFSDELDLGIPESGGQPATVPELRNDPKVDGPLRGLWATAAGSQRVTITHVTESGCYVEPGETAAVDEWASVTVFFSPVRSLTLAATVAAVEPSRGCLLRFDKLSADTKRALRVEIREALAVQGAATRPSVGIGLVTESSDHDDVIVEWHAQAGDLHANQW